MKLPRMYIDNKFMYYDGKVCKSEDVEKLEQLNAEMLEFIKMVNDVSNKNPSLFCEHQDVFYLDSKSIIEKAEVMK